MVLCIFKADLSEPQDKKKTLPLWVTVFYKASGRGSG